MLGGFKSPVLSYHHISGPAPGAPDPGRRVLSLLNQGGCTAQGLGLGRSRRASSELCLLQTEPACTEGTACTAGCTRQFGRAHGGRPRSRGSLGGPAPEATRGNRRRLRGARGLLPSLVLLRPAPPPSPQSAAGHSPPAAPLASPPPLPPGLPGSIPKPAPSWKITLKSRNVSARLAKGSQEPAPCLWNYRFLSRSGLETRPDSRVSLECNPEIPVAHGEEHYILDTSLDEVYFALQ